MLKVAVANNKLEIDTGNHSAKNTKMTYILNTRICH